MTFERQDNSDLAAEQCGLGEARPHLQGVRIPTLPVVDLETEYAAHEAPPQPSGREPRHEKTVVVRRARLRRPMERSLMLGMKQCEKATAPTRRFFNLAG